MQVNEVGKIKRMITKFEKDLSINLPNLFASVDEISIDELLRLKQLVKALQGMVESYAKSVDTLALTKLDRMNIKSYETDDTVFKIVEKVRPSYDYKKIWEVLEKHGYNKEIFKKGETHMRYIMMFPRKKY